MYNIKTVNNKEYLCNDKGFMVFDNMHELESEFEENNKSKKTKKNNKLKCEVSVDFRRGYFSLAIGY